MMVENFPNIPPGREISSDVGFDVLSVSFGDGYSQRMRKGINHKKKSYSVNWKGLSLAKRNQIINFLDGCGGVKPFFWQPKDGDRGKWICSDYSYELVGVSFYNISAKFDLVYDL